jgi:hypothetical protein
MEVVSLDVLDEERYRAVALQRFQIGHPPAR